MRKTINSLLLIAAAGGLAALIAGGAGAAAAPAAAPAAKAGDADALRAFAVVQKVLQHPRCQNCHIPGDAPLQFDDSRVHAQNVKRGPHGLGAPGLACATCHSTANPPASYGPHMPPGAPTWRLPPPEHKMVFIGRTGGQICRVLKDPQQNGGKDMEALLKHVSDDKLVLWGWNPGVGRAPVDIPHDQFVAAFRRWKDAGAPCPAL